MERNEYNEEVVDVLEKALRLGGNFFKPDEGSFGNVCREPI